MCSRRPMPQHVVVLVSSAAICRDICLPRSSASTESRCTRFRQSAMLSANQPWLPFLTIECAHKRTCCNFSPPCARDWPPFSRSPKCSALQPFTVRPPLFAGSHRPQRFPFYCSQQTSTPQTSATTTSTTTTSRNSHRPAAAGPAAADQLTTDTPAAAAPLEAPWRQLLNS